MKHSRNEWLRGLGVLVLVGGVLPTLICVPAVAAQESWDKKFAQGRFIVLAAFQNEAVLDRETGLVWERSPDATTHTQEEGDTTGACITKILGGRLGWRLPSIEELASLLDPNAASDPLLPPNHPFQNVQSGRYWSATFRAFVVGDAWQVNFADGEVDFFSRSSSLHKWCVRGCTPQIQFAPPVYRQATRWQLAQYHRHTCSQRRSHSSRTCFDCSGSCSGPVRTWRPRIYSSGSSLRVTSNARSDLAAPTTPRELHSSSCLSSSNGVSS